MSNIDDRVEAIAKVLEEKHLDIMLANNLPDLGYRLAVVPPVAIDDRLESLRVNFGLASPSDAQAVIDRVMHFCRQGMRLVAQEEDQRGTLCTDEKLGDEVGRAMSVLKMTHRAVYPKITGEGMQFIN